jgi:hypothetical protein
MTGTEEKWLEEVFADGNGWDIDDIRNGAYRAPLQMHLEAMLRPAFENRLPLIIPKLAANKQLWFYIVGENRKELGEICRVISAYLGRVKSRLEPGIIVASDDLIEKIILGRFPSGFSRLYIPLALNPDKSAVYSVFEQLNSAIERYSQRPLSASLGHRPVGRMLSDFFVACGRDDGTAALEYFAELKNSGKVSSRNLISLELQALAAGKNWRELLDHPRLPDMLNGRIPGTIVDIVLNAVMHKLIRSSDPDQHNIEELQLELQSVSNLFFRTPDLDPGRCADLWKVWGIGAAALGYGRALEVLSQKNLNQDWVNQLGRWAGLSPGNVELVDPVEAALQSQPSFDSAAVMLQQALIMNPKDGVDVYQRISTYPSEVLDEILAHKFLRGVWESLESEYSSTVEIDSWASWLDSLVEGSSDALPLQVVVEKSRNWPVEQWNEGGVKKRLFLLADTDASSTVRDVIPILRGWLRERKINVSASFLGQIMVMLAVDDIYSTQDLGLFAELIADLVEAPHEGQQYRDAIEAATVCWERVKSVNSLTQGLEVMDVLLDALCSDSQARLDYWNSLQEFCISSWNRLTDDQQLVVLRTAEDVVGECSQFPPLREKETDAASNLPDMTSKRLAIYTLTEGAARRAGAVLADLFPALDIRLNHDKSATTELVNLADTADFFIFASRSAAHQAFYPVTKRRDDILYPAGKGSSSIIRCFLDAVKA